MEHQDLLRIIQNARAGKEQGFNKFFQQFYASCKPRLFRYAKSQDMIREAYTEAMGKFWQRFVVEGQALPESNIPGYIFNIAKYHLINEQAKKKKYRLTSDDILENTQANNTKTTAVFREEQELEEMCHVALNSAILKIGGTCKKIFNLVREGTEKPKNLYQQLGYKNVRTFSSAKFTCMKKLKVEAQKELNRLLTKRKKRHVLQ